MPHYRTAQKSKIVIFAMLLFCLGAMFSVMFLTLIQGLVVYFGGELKPVELGVLSVLAIVGYMAFLLYMSVFLTKDAIDRVLVVKERE